MSKLFCVPAAGRTSRFPIATWGPKPLIEIQGKTLLEYSLRSLPLDNNDVLKVIVLGREVGEKVEQVMKGMEIPCKYSILTLSKPTKGQAETVYSAIGEYSKERSLIIHNCDTAMVWESAALYKDPRNSLLVFQSEEDRWSYAEINAKGLVTRTEEKMVISKFASTGTYQFESIEVFKEYYKYTPMTKGELYIAPIYNRMIRDGLEVKPIYVEAVYPLGTPLDIKKSYMSLIQNWKPNW